MGAPVTHFLCLAHIQENATHIPKSNWLSVSQQKS
jgi:hypothetical protein